MAGQGFTNALAAKQALIETLNGLASLSDVQTTWGFPSSDPEKRWAYVGKIVWNDSEWATNRSRQERFTLHVGFCVQVFAAKDGEDAETAVLQLAEEAEQALKDNPKLGLSSVVTSDWTPVRMGSWPIDGGQEAQFEVEVGFTARL